MDSSIRNLKTDLANNKVPQSEDDRFLEVMEVRCTQSSEIFLYNTVYILEIR